jgi:hypothetical protein
VFGAEMAPERWYHFLAGCKAAVFSWEGCELEMSRDHAFSALAGAHRPVRVNATGTNEDVQTGSGERLEGIVCLGSRTICRARRRMTCLDWTVNLRRT